MPLSAVISHLLIYGIAKWAEPCKCVILLISRINPSLKEWRFWYLILTCLFFCHNFSFPVYAAPFHPVKDGELILSIKSWRTKKKLNKPVTQVCWLELQTGRFCVHIFMSIEQQKIEELVRIILYITLIIDDIFRVSL